MNPYISAQGNNGAKTIQWGKDSLTNGDGVTEYSHIKEWNWIPISYHITN